MQALWRFALLELLTRTHSRVTPEPSRLDVMMAALVQVEPHLLVFLF